MLISLHLFLQFKIIKSTHLFSKHSHFLSGSFINSYNSFFTSYQPRYSYWLDTMSHYDQPHPLLKDVPGYLVSAGIWDDQIAQHMQDHTDGSPQVYNNHTQQALKSPSTDPYMLPPDSSSNSSTSTLASRFSDVYASNPHNNSSIYPQQPTAAWSEIMEQTAPLSFDDDPVTVDSSYASSHPHTGTMVTSSPIPITNQQSSSSSNPECSASSTPSHLAATAPDPAISNDEQTQDGFQTLTATASESPVPVPSTPTNPVHVDAINPSTSSGRISTSAQQPADQQDQPLTTTTPVPTTYTNSPSVDSTKQPPGDSSISANSPPRQPGPDSTPVTSETSTSTNNQTNSLLDTSNTHTNTHDPTENDTAAPDHDTAPDSPRPQQLQETTSSSTAQVLPRSPTNPQAHLPHNSTNSDTQSPNRTINSHSSQNQTQSHTPQPDPDSDVPHHATAPEAVTPDTQQASATSMESNSTPEKEPITTGQPPAAQLPTATTDQPTNNSSSAPTPDTASSTHQNTKGRPTPALGPISALMDIHGLTWTGRSAPPVLLGHPPPQPEKRKLELQHLSTNSKRPRSPPPPPIQAAPDHSTAPTPDQLNNRSQAPMLYAMMSARPGRPTQTPAAHHALQSNTYNSRMPSNLFPRHPPAHHPPPPPFQDKIPRTDLKQSTQLPPPPLTPSPRPLDAPQDTAPSGQPPAQPHNPAPLEPPRQYNFYKPDWMQYLRRSEWTTLEIKPYHSTILIGDSNVSRISSTFIPPKSWAIASLSGLSYTQAEPLMKQLFPRRLTHVATCILFLGFNDLVQRNTNITAPEKTCDYLNAAFPHARIIVLRPQPHSQLGNPTSRAQLTRALDHACNNYDNILVPTLDCHFGTGRDIIHLNQQGAILLSSMLKALHT